MDGVALILAARAQRMAAGLSLAAHGAEGFTTDQPFTCHARTVEERDRWRAQMERRGFTVQELRT